MIGSEGAMVPTKTPSVSSVRRALTIIETLAHARNGMGVSVVSRKIHAPKSSTHTIFLTLERSGFLRRDDRTGHYSLGLKIFDLVSLCLGKTELREQTRPYLLNLVEQTGLTAHLAILDGDQVVYVDKVESPGLVKMNTWVGRRIDAHCTAKAGIPGQTWPETQPEKSPEISASKPEIRSLCVCGVARVPTVSTCLEGTPSVS
jgi:DNA-binding IclR family transcriptional regulator